MAKKSLIEAATESTSIFDQVARGNAPDAENTKDVKNVKNVKGAKSTKNAPEPQERLNLKIPTYIKEYLNVAAGRASMEQRRNVSLTEYLCELVKEDMKRHQNK